MKNTSTARALTVLAAIGLAAVEPVRAQAVPDILVSVPMNEHNSVDLFQRVTRLMENIRSIQRQRGQQVLPDPFNGGIPSLTINQENIGSALPNNAQTRQMLAVVNSILGTNAGASSVNVTLTNLTYNVNGLRLKVDQIQPNRGNPILTGEIAGQGIRVALDKLRMAVNIPRAGGGDPLVIWAELNNVVVRTVEGAHLPIGVRLRMDHSDPTSLSFNVEDANLRTLADSLSAATVVMELDPQNPVTIPEVRATVGGSRTLALNREGVRNAIVRQNGPIKAAILEQIQKFLRESNNTVYAPFFQTLSQIKVPRDYWIKTPGQTARGRRGDPGYVAATPDLAFKLRYDSVRGENREQGARAAVLTYDIRGAFCLENDRRTNFVWEDTALKDCRTPIPVVPSGITAQQHARSLSTMRARMAADPSDHTATASVSHDYINALLATTVNAGLWNAGLSPNNLSFGDKKVFARFDERVDASMYPDMDEESRRRAGVLYLDLVYTNNRRFMGNLAALFTGQRHIRFPVKVYANIKIENRRFEGATIPHLVIIASGADCLDEGRCVIDEAETRGGRGPHGLVSTVQRARFTPLIRQEIRNAIQGLIGSEVFALPLREFPHVGLEAVDFEVDGNGRMVGTVELGQRGR